MSKLEELIEQYCPDGVEWKHLGEFCEIKTGKGITKKDSNENGTYPIISGGVTPMGYYHIFNREGRTVTISRVGANAGLVSFIDKRFYLNDKCFSIIPSNGTNTKFLYYILSAREADIKGMQSEGGVPTINTQKVGSIEIPVPPLPVQEEIVRVLDTFTELQAELQAELQKRKQQYNYYLDNLLNFKNINRGGHQAEVRWMKMSEVASFTYGYTSKAQDLGNVRYIRITDITDKGQLNPKNGKYVSLTEEVRPYLLKKGDLIMARTGATYGKTLYYNEDYPSAYASFLIKITLNQLVDSKYYWHFTRSSIYWEQANRLVGGGAQPQFNTGAISQVIIPLPSLEEQNRIVSILDRFDTLTNDLTVGLPAEMEKRRQQYEFYRDKLLTFKRKEA